MTTELLSTTSTACTCDPDTVSRITTAINKQSNRRNHRRLMRKSIECRTVHIILSNKNFSKVWTMVCAMHALIPSVYLSRVFNYPTQIKNGSHLAALKLLNESVVEAIKEGDVNSTTPILYFLSNTASDLGNNKVQLEISEV